jgi:pimeloyl-ACP methyl ester carboxylesterase
MLMATFVFVHGSWHGAWCWYRLSTRLQRAGHRVIAPDLLSLGCDTTPYERVTLKSWTEQIASHVLSASEPVVLVGHSRGGIVISEVAERIPERIQKLIYVSAFLLKNGQTLQEVAAGDEQSLVLPGLVVAADRLSASIRPEVARQAFYGECSDEDVALALLLLRAEPLAPIATPVSVSPARFGRVPRAYIGCTRDRAITPSAQLLMQKAWPCEQSLQLATDHSPFLSRPDELTEAVLSVSS